MTFREYYDLTRDPYELTNVLASGPGPPNVAALAADLHRIRTCVGDSCPK